MEEPGKSLEYQKKDIYKRIEPLKESSDTLWKFTQNMIEDAFDKGT